MKEEIIMAAPEFKHLFTPLQLGHFTVKNRIVTSAHADALAEDGMPKEKARRYYEEKAKGGVGVLMCFGSAGVHPTSPAQDWNGVELFEDRVIPYLAEFADTMHVYNVPVISQITHRGRRGRSVDRLHRMYGPSPIREPNHRETPHTLDEEMITEFVQAFSDAAWRLKQGNFDGCEVNASHCHLIDQFWTLNANQRTDAYGGSLPNRMRFGIRVLEGIRERCGDNFIIGIRITGNDFTKGGLNNSMMQEIVGNLDALGILDYFSVIGATAETFVGEAKAVPDMTFSHATYAPLAASIKRVVSVPVITAGRVTHPVEAEQVVANEQADLVIMTRAIIADPQAPQKAMVGQLDDIRLCRGYNEGCIDRIYTGRGVTCVQNATIGRETELDELTPAEQPRKVVVVGGGPAGLEAARIARWRGHEVVLMEKDSELGGQTLIAAKAPLRGEFSGATEWMGEQCRKAGVDVRLNCAATVESILSEFPDVVVVATGARSLIPEVPGIENAVDSWSVLNGDIPEGERIVVIDEEYGFQGPNVAELLLDAGKSVEIITSMEAICTLLGATTRPPVYQRLFGKGIVIHPHLHLRAIEGEALITENAWTETRSELNGYDAVVYAFGGQAVDELSQSFPDEVTCFVVGDAFAPRTLQHAIMEGHTFARKI
ncbi:FAD-dependent oxidoreductase [Candidatus Poribacteria bacterium]|nr:FAD-dependent oxidoreductase [Candidatus Poribacteria bacterium]